MDVSVLHERAQQRLPGADRPSVLGHGMLERARATSLALLGLTAAVGLAIVALALNQGWPLIADSSIPRVPPPRQAVGAASIVAGAEATGANPPFSGRAARQSGGTARSASGRSVGGSPAAVPPTTGSAELVIAPPAPPKPAGGPSHGGSKPTRPPVAEQPQQGSTTGAAPPEASPESIPPPAPVEPGPPTATPSEAPSESHVPSWSNGRGHAYGRDSSDVDDESDDQGDDWDDQSDDWDDHGHSHHHDD